MKFDKQVYPSSSASDQLGDTALDMPIRNDESDIHEIDGASV